MLLFAHLTDYSFFAPRISPYQCVTQVIQTEMCIFNLDGNLAKCRKKIIPGGLLSPESFCSFILDLYHNDTLCSTVP